MSVSKLLAASDANDFNISITGSYVSVTFTKEYPQGAYTLISSVGDTTFDIYIFASDGTSAGYTNTNALTASKGFTKIVILGSTINDLLSFSYKTTYVSQSESNAPTAGPVATSVSPSAVPNVNDTFTLTGRNFASDATVTFTSANTAYPATAAKAVTYVSATSLTVTRPDNLIIANSPYTLTVTNPGITNPTGSSSNVLVNAITAGASPVWVTGTTLPVYTKNVAYSTTVSATDPDAGGSITYSQVSSALPTGITFTSTSATISGTATVTDSGTITIRATDTGGNFTDRTFTLPNVGAAVPTWVTAAGELSPVADLGSAYTTTVAATDDSGAAPTYSLVSGTLLTGLSLNSSTGVISGTPTAANGGASFTIRATDANGGFADRAFNIFANTVTEFTSTQTVNLGTTTLFDLLVVGGGGAGGATAGYSSGGSGGGGGGAVIHSTNVSISGSYTITVGAGGVATTGSNTRCGGNTTAFGVTAPGGNGGARSGNGGNECQFNNPAITGGGGASYGSGGAEANNQGSPTYTAAGSSGGGSGRGGAGARQSVSGVDGGAGTSITIGTNTYSVGGGGGAGGSGGAGNGVNGGGGGRSVNNLGGGDGTTNRGGGGGGRSAVSSTGSDAIGSNGGSGIVVIRYKG
jgi:hypothetical protein